MITQEVIRSKYCELYDKYADRHIDDYGTFVLSRVLEFFINNSEEATDGVRDLIEDAFTNKVADASCENASEVNQDESESGELSEALDLADVDAETSNDEVDEEREETQ